MIITTKTKNPQESGDEEDKTMMKDLTKAFIIMTLVFEVMTIAGLAAFYHVFGIICIAVVIATILFHIFKNMGSMGDGSGEIIPEGA